MENKYRRGEIYRLKRNIHGYDAPVLVIQNDIGNEYGRNTVVAFLTTEVPASNGYPFVVVCSPRDSGMGKIYAVDLAYIMTIPGSMLGEKCGQLSTAKMMEVDDALKNSLGLV